MLMQGLNIGGAECYVSMGHTVRVNVQGNCTGYMRPVFIRFKIQKKWKMSCIRYSKPLHRLYGSNKKDN